MRQRTRRARHGRAGAIHLPRRACAVSLDRVRTTRLQVTLGDVVPAVVRVVDVPAVSTLPELHDVLQVALGWTGSHLHQFVAEGATYAPPDADAPPWQQDETGVRLRELPDRFTYLYDLGDGWEHEVRVLGPGGDRPACLYGEGACPPEDCGGPSGYEHLKAVLADHSHEDHEATTRWVGERRDFDQAVTDEQVRQAVGVVPASVRLLLDLTAGGMRLTPGGRLPRVLVRQVQEQRRSWYPLDRPASVEEDLLPLAVLHDLLRSVGLLRLRHGVLTPTKAAADDLEVVRRLRSWFEPGSFVTVVTELVVAELAASGPLHGHTLARRVHALLGRGWFRGAEPLTDEDLLLEVHRMAAAMQGLDLVEVDEPVWRAGPSALSLLPRAVVLTRALARRTDEEGARQLTR
jgi:Plasmid pRiA4b ORF-3-like protein